MDEWATLHNRRRVCLPRARLPGPNPKAVPTGAFGRTPKHPGQTAFEPPRYVVTVRVTGWLIFSKGVVQGISKLGWTPDLMQIHQAATMTQADWNTQNHTTFPPPELCFFAA